MVVKKWEQSMWKILRGEEVEMETEGCGCKETSDESSSNCENMSILFIVEDKFCKRS